MFTFKYLNIALRDNALAAASGIENSIFVHISGFLLLFIN
jgi:uncharacterized UPF0160 family protein